MLDHPLERPQLFHSKWKLEMRGLCMLLILLVAEEGELGEVYLRGRRKLGIEAPRQGGSLLDTSISLDVRKTRKGTMQQGGDIDSNPEGPNTIRLVELELCNERGRSTFESSFVFSSLDGIFDCHDLVLRVLDPGECRGSRSTPFTAALIGVFNVRFDLLPVRKVTFDISNPFDQPRDCLVGCALVSFVDFHPRAPRPFRSSFVLERNATD